MNAPSSVLAKPKIRRLYYFLFPAFLIIMVALEIRKPTILRIPPGTLTLILSLIFAQLVVLAYRMLFLMKILEERVSFSNAIKVQFYPVFLNYSLSSAIGITFKALLLKEHTRNPLGKVVALITLEVLIDVSAMMLVLFLTGYGNIVNVFVYYKTHLWIIGVVAGIIVLVAGILFIRNREKLFTAVCSFSTILKVKRGYLFAVILLTGVNYLLLSLYNYLAYYHFYPDLGFSSITGIVTASNLVGLLSPLPGGIGISEAFMCFLGKGYSISLSRIISISFFLRNASLLMIGVFVMSSFLREALISKITKGPIK
jgi:uncharacterized membrane protein YbhN (UPF0104 family)